MAARSGKRRTRGGEDLRNTKTLSPARNTCRACRLSMQRGSGCGADRMVACVFLPHWEKRPGAPDQKEAEKLAFESSPDASVATWKSPVLLIHGDDDRNVPFGQTVDLAQRLREQKVYFEELIFPDEIHDFLIWRNWVRAYKASVDFFAEELGQRASGGKP